MNRLTICVCFVVAMFCGMIGGLDSWGQDAGTQAIVVDGTDKAVTEGVGCTVGNSYQGGGCLVHVHLAQQPSGNATVTFVASPTRKIIWQPYSLTFTTSNWNVDKNVLILGLQDADNVNESVTLTASTPGASDVVINVVVTDDDP